MKDENRNGAAFSFAERSDESTGSSCVSTWTRFWLCEESSPVVHSGATVVNPRLSHVIHSQETSLVLLYFQFYHCQENHLYQFVFPQDQVYECFKTSWGFMETSLPRAMFNSGLINTVFIVYPPQNARARVLVILAPTRGICRE